MIKNKFTVDSVKLTLNKESKHWGQWDRWVAKFDHHWKWLNNWIGEKNYRYFFSLIWLFMMHNIFIWTVCLFQIIDFHIDELELSGSKSNFEIFYSSSNGEIIRIVSYILWWILLVLWTLKAITSGQLISFHIYLKCKNLTTYKYIILQRKNKAEKLKLKLSKNRNELESLGKGFNNILRSSLNLDHKSAVRK